MLTAVVPAALLSNPVTAQVFVKTGDPMGSAVSSNSVFFEVTAAQSSPNISISPTSALPGSSDITLTITGSTGKFDNAPNNLSRAVWLVNGTKTVLTTTFVSSTMLTAVVPAALLSQAVEAEVLVETGAPSGSPHRSNPALPLFRSGRLGTTKGEHGFLCENDTLRFLTHLRQMVACFWIKQGGFKCKED